MVFMVTSHNTINDKKNVYFFFFAAYESYKMIISCTMFNEVLYASYTYNMNEMYYFPTFNIDNFLWLKTVFSINDNVPILHLRDYFCLN